MRVFQRLLGRPVPVRPPLPWNNYASPAPSLGPASLSPVPRDASVSPGFMTLVLRSEGLEGLEPSLGRGGPKNFANSVCSNVAREACISTFKSCLTAVIIEDFVLKDKSEATEDDADWFPTCSDCIDLLGGLADWLVSNVDTEVLS